MCFSGGDDFHAIIKYSINAVLEPSFGMNLKKMKHKQRLIIRQPAYNNGISAEQVYNGNIYACCCFGNKGNVSLKTQFEKTTYIPTETCRAIADLDNSNCSADCKSIDLELVRILEMKDKKGIVFTDRRIVL